MVGVVNVVTRIVLYVQHHIINGIRLISVKRILVLSLLQITSVLFMELVVMTFDVKTNNGKKVSSHRSYALAKKKAKALAKSKKGKAYHVFNKNRRMFVWQEY